MKNSFEIGKSRMESFSDGVIAIIITLMIFNVKMPEVSSDLSSRETWSRLAAILPHFFAYSLSFILLGIYWVNHHHFFHSLSFTDRTILWYNLNLLFWLSILP